METDKSKADRFFSAAMTGDIAQIQLALSEGISALRICKNCFREFNKNESSNYSPARDLGDIFISDIGDTDVNDLCPDCREELGLMNLLGFKP